MRLKLTLPGHPRREPAGTHRGEHRALFAFVLGLRAERGPDPVPPANYRPFVPPRHVRGDRLALLPGHMRQRPCTTHTGQPFDPRTVVRVMPRGPQPATAPGLTPAAHTPPPVDRLAEAAETTMAMPHVIDLDEPYEARLQLVDTSIEQLLKAAHATTLGAVGYYLELWGQERDRLDELAARLFPPTPPRIPQFDDIAVPFATGRRRAPLPPVQDSARLTAMLPAAPARHALPGGAR